MEPHHNHCPHRASAHRARRACAGLFQKPQLNQLIEFIKLVIYVYATTAT